MEIPSVDPFLTMSGQRLMGMQGSGEELEEEGIHVTYGENIENVRKRRVVNRPRMRWKEISEHRQMDWLKIE